MTLLEMAKAAITDYIAKYKYTYSVDDIIHEYIKQETGCYVSYTANDVIKNNRKELEYIAISALKEQADRSNPKPLTLDELKQMDGEPVYLVSNGEDFENGWRIHIQTDSYLSHFNWLSLHTSQINKTWTAYRYKLTKEGAE